mmetsp:Transcript_29830/g.33271  ORF Transcript_29830/g.33271 Transcript_29830/m.33271 type:complete len:252 (-) Transcript_29830:7-762(-)
MIRKSLLDIYNDGKIDGKSKALWIDGQEVSVVYMRSGYSPEHHPTQKEWDARLIVEESLAIKCPNIMYHLVGTKKVQQILGDPDVLKKFVPKEEAILLRSSFAGLYSLDSTEVGQSAEKVKAIIDKVISNPGAYVMKPQREGGGNLLHGDEMVKALKTLSPSELAAYILMDRITPKPVDTHILRKNPKTKIVAYGRVEAICEMGTFGLFVHDGKKVVLNKCGGTLVRTKSAKTEDGGVYSGVAALDSLHLV